VTAALGPAGVRVWEVMSRGWGPRTGRPLPEAMVLKETRSNSQIPTPFPHRFPLNSHALTSVEGLLGKVRLTRRFRRRLPRRLGESISVVAGSRNHDNQGLADASAANPFRSPRLHPGIGSVSGSNGAPRALRCLAAPARPAPRRLPLKFPMRPRRGEGRARGAESSQRTSRLLDTGARRV
jgi:hypothetical protein